MSSSSVEPDTTPRGGTGVPGRILVGGLLLLVGVILLVITHALLSHDTTVEVEDRTGTTGAVTMRQVTCGSVLGADDGGAADAEQKCSQFRDAQTGYAIEFGLAGVLLVGGGAMVLRHRPRAAA